MSCRRLGAAPRPPATSSPWQNPRRFPLLFPRRLRLASARPGRSLQRRRLGTAPRSSARMPRWQIPPQQASWFPRCLSLASSSEEQNLQSCRHPGVAPQAPTTPPAVQNLRSRDPLHPLRPAGQPRIRARAQRPPSFSLQPSHGRNFGTPLTPHLPRQRSRQAVSGLTVAPWLLTPVPDTAPGRCRPALWRRSSSWGADAGAPSGAAAWFLCAQRRRCARLGPSVPLCPVRSV